MPQSFAAAHLHYVFSTKHRHPFLTPAIAPRIYESMSGTLRGIGCVPLAIGGMPRGEPIGSGLIEGACKQVIGKRMKQTGARWTVANANRMAELCCLTYSDQWAEYWLAA